MKNIIDILSPIASMLTIIYIADKITNSKKFFDCKGLSKTIKKEIYQKTRKYLYLETKKAYRTFLLKRSVCFINEIIIPISIDALLVVLLKNYSFYNLLLSIVIVASFSLIYANYYNNLYSVNFYIAEVNTSIKDEDLVGREIIRIDGQNFYISNYEENAYLKDDKYFLIKYKTSNFEKQEIKVFKTYLKEFIEILAGYKESDFCDDKNKAEEMIDKYNKLLNIQNELL